MKKAVIVIPTYNEAANIENLIRDLSDTVKKIRNWQVSALVVDSSSPDGTARLVEKLQKTYDDLFLLKMGKEGLGKAYVKGFKFAFENLKPDVLFEMDADYSHDPREIADFLKKIDQGADFVIGSRYMRGGSIPKNWGFHRKLFSIVGNLIIRFGFMKPKITDWTSGYRAIKGPIVKEALSYIEKYSGYVFQVALLDFAIKKHADISQIPINFIERKYGRSKINSFQFSLQTLFYVFFKSSFIRYALVGVGGAAIDFGISYLFIEVYKIATNLFWLATIVSAELAIIFNFTANNFWSFAHKKLEHKLSVYMTNLLKFNLIAGGALIVQAAGVQLLTNLYGPRYWFVYKFFILALIVIPYSYILYNKIIWKAKTKDL